MFSVDWQNKIVDSDSNITDVVAAHQELRELETSDTGILYPTIIFYKELDLGNGAKFPSIDFINGYQLRFPTPGNYVISGGNLNATIIPVSDVYLERITSAAYAVTSVGSSGGATADDIAKAVRTELSTELSHLMVLQNGMGLSSAQATMLLEIYALYGLDPSKPLIVTDASRSAGAEISQQITSNPSTTTIQRL